MTRADWKQSGMAILSTGAFCICWQWVFPQLQTVYLCSLDILGRRSTESSLSRHHRETTGCTEINVYSGPSDCSQHTVSLTVTEAGEAVTKPWSRCSQVLQAAGNYRTSEWPACLGACRVSNRWQKQREPCWHLHISESRETTGKEVANLHTEVKMKLTKVPLQSLLNLGS